MARVTAERAYLLHARPYRETSLILEILSDNYGRVSLVQRGVRSGTKAGQDIQPFSALRVSWSGKGEIHTLTGVDIDKRYPMDDNLHKVYGLYLNELIMKLVPKHGLGHELFALYESTLEHIACSNIEVLLRMFELRLLQLIGYGLDLGHDFEDSAPVDAQNTYYYDHANGGVTAVGRVDTSCPVSGKTLQVLDRLDFAEADQRSLKEAKRLLRNIIDSHLHGKPLKSRQIMQYLYH